MTDHREEAIRLMWALDWTFEEALDVLASMARVQCGPLTSQNMLRDGQRKEKAGLSDDTEEI